MSVEVTLVQSKTKQVFRSEFDRRFKMLDELEHVLKESTSLSSPEWCYVAKLGAVKRKYKYNYDTTAWERVYHPRGTKKKKKVEVKCEFQDDYNKPIHDTGRWLSSAYKKEAELVPYLGRNMHTGPQHHHRITYSDGSVAYYTHNGDNILRKFDTLPEWHTKGKETPSESAEVKQSPKPIRHEFCSKHTNEWLPGTWTYERLLELVAEGELISPASYPYRVTFDDGSVTYFTRDNERDPLVERKTLDQPTQSPVVPCSIDDFYSVPAKKGPLNGWVFVSFYCSNKNWLEQSQVDGVTDSADLPGGWITIDRVQQRVECGLFGRFMYIKDGVLKTRMEITRA